MDYEDVIDFIENRESYVENLKERIDSLSKEAEMWRNIYADSCTCIYPTRKKRIVKIFCSFSPLIILDSKEKAWARAEAVFQYAPEEE